MLSSQGRIHLRRGGVFPNRRLLVACAPLFVALAAPGATLVGDNACSACHQEKVRSFHLTAHARTSSAPSADSIHGKFGPDANALETSNPSLTFVMEANERGFFQTAHMRTSATEEVSRSERIDIVVGSGRKGQTYLFWDGDQLFELPVSYGTDKAGWIDSPGYVDGTADFDRPIVPRCLECHATSFANRPPPENRYLPTSLVLGVSCERCHGPGSDHVARFRSAAPPKDPSGYAIVNPARLSRARQLDVCAVCHNGAGESVAAPLSFVPGDDLSKFLVFSRWDPKAHLDVHARQVPLLEASRCFRFSKTLTCVTCHDVHTAQRDTSPFVSRCMACHKVENCGEFPKRGHAIDTRCIDCHMPLQETGKIVLRVDGSTVHPKVRTHRIAVYPDAVAP
jgi:cytochrome c554/c'-like protein